MFPFLTLSLSQTTEVSPPPSKEASSAPSSLPSVSSAPSHVESGKPSSQPSMTILPTVFSSSQPSDSPTFSYVPTQTTQPTTFPTLEPTSTPTTSFLPTVSIEYYYADWLSAGCRRKPLAEFGEWETIRFDSVGECCDVAFSWDFTGCVQKSVTLIYTIQSAPVHMTSAPDEDD